MSDIQTMRGLVKGLRQKRENLMADKDIFLKLSGINEEIEKANQDKEGFEEELIEAKVIRDAAKNRKSASVSKTVSEIEKKMNAVLPSGEALFTYYQDENEKFTMQIGWKDGDKRVPYNGLSGGEKQIFDAALANVLDANIIVVEAAELDDENLLKTLNELRKLDKQVIVNTCHSISETNLAPFKVVEV